MNEKIESYIEEVTGKLICSKEEKQDLTDELRDHLYSSLDDFIQQGISEREASLQAIEAFGQTSFMRENFQQVVNPLYGWIRKIALLAFSFYFIVVLFKLIIFRLYNRLMGPYVDLYGTKSFFDYSFWKETTNLVPFKTVYFYMTAQERVNMDTIVENLAGNLLLLLPLGLLVPFLLKRYEKFTNVLWLAFITSVMIEIIQFVFRIGSADIDDVILNTLGAAIGYAMYKGIMFLLLQRVKYIDKKGKLI